MLSIKEEGEEHEYGPLDPFSYQNFLMKFFSFGSGSCQETGAMEEIQVEPPRPLVEVGDLGVDVTNEKAPLQPQAPMGTDSEGSVDYTESVTTVATGVNTTA